MEKKRSALTMIFLAIAAVLLAGNYQTGNSPGPAYRVSKQAGQEIAHLITDATDAIIISERDQDMVAHVRPALDQTTVVKAINRVVNAHRNVKFQKRWTKPEEGEGIGCTLLIDRHIIMEINLKSSSSNDYDLLSLEW